MSLMHFNKLLMAIKEHWSSLQEKQPTWHIKWDLWFFSPQLTDCCYTRCCEWWVNCGEHQQKNLSTCKLLRNTYSRIVFFQNSSPWIIHLCILLFQD